MKIKAIFLSAVILTISGVANADTYDNKLLSYVKARLTNRIEDESTAKSAQYFINKLVGAEMTLDKPHFQFEAQNYKNDSFCMGL